jgi:hypothetical protein
MDKIYNVMHHNIPVMDIMIDDDYNITKVKEIYDMDHVFPGLTTNGYIDKNKVQKWLLNRGIPAKREEIEDILKINNVMSREELIFKNLGLGLTDYYWVKPENNNSEWKNINFFENDFTQEKEDVYTGASDINFDEEDNYETLITPNNMSSGMLPKRWEKKDGICYLIKGSEQSFQEPLNEKVASEYLDNLNILHVPYDIVWHKEIPYSKCPNMLKTNEELIHSHDVIKTKEKDNNTSYFQHYINCCMEMGLSSNIEKELGDMILVDYMMANTDRHWANFGVIRDVNTLRATRLAPLYDHGASLYMKINNYFIESQNVKLKCRSFTNKQEDNIRLVKDLSLLENRNIYMLPTLIDKYYNKGFRKFIDSNRIENINIHIKKRIIAAHKRNFYSFEKLNGELNNNIRDNIEITESHKIKR